MITIMTVVPALLIASPASPQSVGSLEDLRRQLEPDARVRVDDRSGTRTNGRFVRAAADELVIATDQGEKRFAREDVRVVAARARFTQLGTFIGAGIGAAVGAYQECRGEGRHPECADGMVLLGGIGCGIGALAGLAIPRTTVLYRAPESRVLLAPVVRPHSTAVVAIARW